MEPDFITISSVLQKFKNHGQGSRVREWAMLALLDIIAHLEPGQVPAVEKVRKTLQSLMPDFNPVSTKPPLPTAFRKDAEVQSQKTPINTMHNQRLAMLIMLQKYPKLSSEMGITSIDKRDLEQCFDPHKGGSQRYRDAFDRMTGTTTPGPKVTA